MYSYIFHKMMKRLISFMVFCICFGLTIKAQSISIVGTEATITGSTAGCLVGTGLMSLSDKQMITKLTISGNIDATDFKVIRDDMSSLSNIDLNASSIATYSGTDGTNGSTYQTYPENTLPIAAFKDVLQTVVISLPTTMTAIGSSAFYKAYGMTSLIVPNAVTTIGDYAFSYNFNLTAIDLPSTLTAINTHAFDGCSNLNTINSYSQNPSAITLGAEVFTGVPLTTCILNVPQNSLSAYQAATIWQNFTNISATLAIIDALTSIKVNIQNVMMSGDQKTLSYDVYVQDIDALNQIAIPGFIFRLAVPQANLGSNAKTVTVTNASSELGATAATMSTNGTNWLMKFTGANLITTYNDALMASSTFPGTLLGTFNITNTNGTSFSNPQTMNLAWAGSSPLQKTTISIFEPNSTTLATNSTTCLPSSSYAGVQNYSLTPYYRPTTITDPSITLSKLYNGNTTAAATAGTLSGLLPGDVGRVDVTATATYDNSNVGTGKTITVSYSLSGPAAINYAAPANFQTTSGVITPIVLTAANPTLTTSKQYDGLTTAVVTPGALTGVLAGDVANVTLVPTANYATTSVGTGKTINVTYALTGTAATNYTAPTTYSTNSGVITAKALSATDPTLTTTKQYDGLTTAVVTPGGLIGVVAGDVANVTLVPTANYATPGVGTGKTINVTYALTGSAAANYSAPTTYTTNTGAITAKPLTAANPTLTTSKQYDGLTSAVVTPGALTGVLAGDVANVALVPTANYATKVVGTSKTIDVTYSLSGTAATNYTAPTTYSVSSGVITAKALTAANPTLTTTKPYDGLTTAVVTPGALSGVVAGDVSNVTLVATANYTTAAVGTNKTIDVVYTLTGSDATNYIAPITYSVTNGAITSSIILTASAPTLTTSKQYDGLTSAVVTPGTLSGVLPGDVGNVTLSAVANYTTSAVGTGKTINVVYSISGSAASNYTVPATYQVTNGAITAIALTAANPTLTTSKQYDGLTTAVVTPGALTGVLAGDVANVTLVPTANYATTSVGTGKTINVTYALTGTAATNYTAPTTYSTNSGVITAKALSAANPTLTTSKQYDGLTTAVVTPGALTGVLAGDVANVTLVPTANYATKAVGTGKTIDVVYTLTGSAATNYSAPTTYTVINGVITAKALTAANPTLTTSKQYDGFTTAVVSPGALTGVETGDVANVTLVATANYTTAAVGTNKTIDVVYTLTGSEATNYTAPTTYSVSNGVITTKALTASNPTLTTTKLYDETTSATVTAGALTGVAAGDVSNVTLNAVASYSTPTAGTGKTITVVYSLTGSAAANYTAPADYQTSSGVITAIELVITPPTVTSTRPYNGSTVATFTGGFASGVLAGDISDVTVIPSPNYTTPGVGIDKTIVVTYSIIGSKAINYKISSTFQTTGNITAKALTAANPTLTTSKQYDGLTTATVTAGALTGVVAGDVANVTLVPTANYTTTSVGTGKTINVTYALTGTAATNYSAPADYQTNSGVITAKALSATDPTLTTTKQYDGLTTATATAGALTGVLAGDVANVTLVPTANYATPGVGTGKTINVTYALTGSAAANYSAPTTYTTNTGAITAIALTAANPTLTTTKQYDGLTSAVVTPGALTGVLAGDVANVALVPTANYATKVVGTGKTIDVTYSLSGTAATNYTAPTTYSVSSGVITAKALTAANPTLTTTKPYDGLTTAVVTPGALSGVVAGDVSNVTLVATANYTTAAVGTNKTIDVVYTLTGSDATNYIAPITYSVTNGAITSSIILTASAPTLTTSKQYDGLTSAVVTPGTLSGVLPGDVGNVTLSAVANYTTSAVGTGKTINVVYSISGSAASNYTVPATYQVTNGAITAIALTAANPTLTTSKQYDGLTTAVVTPGALTGVLAGDVANVTLVPTANYITSGVGTSKTINVTYALTGTAATNYTAPTTYSTNSGAITAKPLTAANPVLPASKQYDGLTSSTATAGALTGVVAGDVANVTLVPTANYATPGVGTGKTINVTYALTGSAAANYSAPTTYTTNTGAITAIALTAANPTLTTTKQYDGLTSAVVTPGALTGVLAGDVANVALVPTANYATKVALVPTANYATKVVGTSKTIDVTYSLSGTAATNYTAPTTYSVSSGVITAKALTAANPTLTTTKPYDGLTTAVVTPGALSGVVAGDVSNVTLVATANYTTAAVGTNKTIDVVYTLTGSDATNYIAPITYSVTNGAITSSIILTASAPTLTTSKQYDGLTSAVVTPGTLSGVLPGDVGNVTLSAVANYTTSAVGTGKTINVVYSISGSAASNYTVPATYQVTNGAITAIALTAANPTLTTSKQYDGLTTAVVTPGALTGVLAGDVANVTLVPTANYATATVGTSKTINVVYTLTGSAATNYTAPTTYSTNSGAITAKPLTAANPVLPASKQYDGLTSSTATAGALTGVLAGDVANVTLVPTANYATPGVGTGKTINVTYALTGSAAANYSAPTTYTTNTGAITAIALTAANPTLTTTKQYDGLTSAVVTPGALTGVLAGDIANVALVPTANYATKVVGTGKTIDVTYSLSGTAATNYTAPTTYSVSSGVITAKALTAANPTLTTTKPYDGLTTAVVTPGALSGVVAGDVSNVTLVATANYTTAAVGTNKTIDVVYTLTGSDATNYIAPITYSVTNGAITSSIILTASAPTLTTSKMYDGNTSAVVTPGILSGVLPGDVGNVTLTAVANYTNANAGSGKTINVVYSLSGPAAANYTAPATYQYSSGFITAIDVTINAVLITNDKVYDGTTTASFTGGSATGILPDDIAFVNLVSTVNYATPFVGTGIIINATYSLTGARASNYTVSTTSSTFGSITAKPLTAANPVLPASKQYDGLTSSTATAGALTGVVAGDVANVTLVPTANYATPGVGTGKTINVTYALTGSAAANYSAPTTYTTNTGAITAIALTAANPTLTTTKQYDGLTSAVVTPGALTGVLAGDVANVALVPTANYATKVVGTGKTIDVTYSLSGTAATNYTAPTTYSVSSGVITAKALTAANPTLTTTKPYDGLTTAVVTPGALSGVVAGDVSNVTLVATANYTTAAVGTNKTIDVVYTLTGSDATNYIAPITYSVTNGAITSSIILTASAPTLTTSKQYDGLTSAVVTPGTLSGVLPGDVGNVTLSAVANYTTSAVGTSKTIDVVYTLTGSAAANYTAPANYQVTNGAITAIALTAANPTLTTSKQYDGLTTAVVTPGALTGVLAGDVANVTLVPTANYATTSVGTGKTINVTYALTGTAATNYTAPTTYSTNSGVITAKALSAANPTLTTSKQYDGLTTAVVTPGALTGVLAGDVSNVTLVPTANYTTKTVGAGKTIDVVYSLSGTAATNYTAPTTYSVSSGVITAKALTAANPTLTTTKPYDGLTTAVVTPGALTGVVAGDVSNVTLVATANYTTAAVGTNKTIDVVYTLTGSDATNYIAPITYSVTNGAITSSIILTASAPTLTTSKQYDGLTSAVVTPGTLSGVLPGDVGNVTLSAVANYTTSAVGTGKTINVVYSISGSAASNYTVPATYQVTNGAITAIALTAANPTLTTSKQYDGLTTAVVTPGALTGVLAGDVANVTLVPTANYATTSVGTGKTINVTYALTGTAATNYTAPTTYSTNSGAITAKALTASNPTLTTSKLFDGTTTAAVTAGTLSGVLAGDVANVALVATANYASATVGTNKTIDVVYSLTGSAAASYSAPATYQINTGVIASASAIVLTASNPTLTTTKGYDGLTTAVVTPGSLTGVQAGDVGNVTLVATANYTTSSVGTGKTINVVYALTGSAASKYMVPSDYQSTSGAITAKALTASNPTLTTSKLFDGLTTAAVTAGTLSGVLAGDVANVALVATANYASATVGTNKTIDVVYSLTGSAAANYSAPATYQINTGVIASASAIVLTASNPTLTTTKVYDGLTTAVVTPGSLTGVQAGDVGNVTLVATANYTTSGVGTGKTINVVYTLTGSAASNYMVPSDFQSTSGAITAKALTASNPTLTASKVYDGLTTAVVTAGSLTGVLAGDVANVTLVPTANYATATVGTSKTIDVVYTLTGSAAANYTAPANYQVTNGAITAIALTAANPTLTTSKQYDGLTTAVVTPGALTGVLAGDVANVTLVPTANYATTSVGTGKTINVTYALTGSAATNYTAPTTYSTNSGAITAKALTASNPTLTTSKLFDGTTTAAVTAGTLSGVLAGDVANVALVATANYASATVGTNKTIDVVYSLTGSAAASYSAPATYQINTGVIASASAIVLTASNPTLTTTKGYDGLTTAVVTPGSLTGVQAGDVGNVTLVATANYTTSSVGTGKTINVVYALTGSAASKYMVPSDYQSTSGAITAKALTASNPTLTTSKLFDGLTTAAVTAGTLSGVLAGDVANVALVATANYASATVGTNKTIDVVYSLTGSAAANYSAPATYQINTGVIASASAIVLTASNPTLTTTKVYDGLTTAVVTPGSLTGVQAGDVGNVTLVATANYTTSGVGTGKTINVVYTLTGSAASNYMVPSDFQSTSGAITAKALTASNPTLTASKVYDGLTTAVVTAGSLTGVLAGDVANVTLVPTANYATATVGTSKTIDVVYTLTGSAAANYTAPANYQVTNGAITAIALTAANPTLTTSKQYDGLTTAVVTPGALTGVLAGDVANVTLVPTANYATTSVGTGKTINVTYALTGSAATNYTAPTTYSTNSGAITAKALTASNPTLTTSKLFDGTTTAAVTAGTLSGVLAGDVANVALVATANYASATVGTNKTIDVVYSLTGSAAASYSAPATYQINTGVIASASAIVLTASNPTLTTTKGYDGLTTAVVTPGSLTGVQAGDVGNVTLVATANYTTSSVGTGKTINVVYALTGSAASKYMVPSDYQSTSGAITAKALTASNPTLTTSKLFDGLTTAAVTAGTLSGVLAGDVANVALVATANYASATVGTNKTIDVVYSLTGSAAANYSAPATYQINTGVIASASAIVLTASNPTLTTTKVYDGLTTAVVTPGSLTGVQAGDVGNVTLVATANYTTSGVGTGKTINVVYTLTGSAASNYMVPSDFQSTSGAITAKALTASNPTLTASKVYDGLTTAVVTAGSLTGVLAGDVANVTLVPTANYATATVGTSKTIDVVYTLTGSAAANYTAPANYQVTNGAITAIALTAANPTLTTSKQYDGLTTAVVTPGALTGVLAGDVANVTLVPTANYATTSVGTGKTINVTYALTGSAATNYTAPTTYSTNSGAITAKALTASNPTLTTSKVYDGLTTAVVTAGSLTGVLAGDVANVTLVPTANYATATVGTSKTIDVVYTLTGSAAANYTAPANYQVTNGEITSAPLSDKSLNVKVYLEGLWNSGSQNMNKCKEWSDDIQDVVDKFPGDIADKVTIELHGTPYSNIAYTFSDLELHQDGTVTSSGLSYISIPSTISGSYYITVQTRNHIETTTASMVSFSTATIDYDFTDAVTKAFESDASFTPTKEIDGKWMLYAGDDLRNTVSPEIEFGDLYEIFNNKSADTEIYGYLPIDLNGDGVADESDMYLMFANNTIFFYIE